MLLLKLEQATINMLKFITETVAIGTHRSFITYYHGPSSFNTKNTFLIHSTFNI